ncbi:MAG: YjbF family lipoprotein [Proteobacteria bacterium]|nr:YjbF family lipoprotein [Pseudomonadota bacterium]
MTINLFDLAQLCIVANRAKIPVVVIALFLVATLPACSSSSNAILQTLPHAYGRNSAIDSVKLNPNFRYIRVTTSGRVALLALGYVDADPRGPIEVWYSAEREVLRFQNGRLIGAVGLTTEWRDVVLPDLPSWAAVAGGDKAFRWTRIRDVMPGYRYGVIDILSLSVVKELKRGELQGLNPNQLTWFEERFELGPVAGPLGNGVAADLILPPARYAVDLRDGQETVVYGEQCLAADLCFTWQRWSVQLQNSTERK